MALSAIARQKFQYIPYSSRTLQSNGQWLSEYGTPVDMSGSVQPVSRQLYEQMGLDLQKDYINVYVAKNALDVDRDVSGDQLIFNGNYYQVVSKTDWFAMDGWDALLCVRVLNPAS